MKKTICFCLLFVLGITLCGCNNAKEDFSINNHNWKFSHIQNNNGEIIACSDENKYIYENTKILDIWSSIKDGKILISNNVTQETWAFDYKLKEKNADNNIYDVTYTEQDEKKSGLATVGITSKENTDDEYTLILSIGDYVIYFYETK